MWKLEGPYMLMDMDETLTVVRQGRSADADVLYVDGLPTAAHPASAFSIVATWQPMSGKDLLMVPEAFREQQNARMWQRHYGADPTPHVDIGDVIVRQGTAWQVQNASDWGDYTETTVRAIDVGSLAGVVADLITDPTTGMLVAPQIYPATPAQIITGSTP